MNWLLIVTAVAFGASVNRTLDDPKCFVKSYYDGTELTFGNLLDPETNKTYESIEKLAIDFGHAWQGHKLHCIDEPESNQIINSFGEILTVAKKPPGKSMNLKKRQSDPTSGRPFKNILDYTAKSPICVPLVSKHPGANPYHPLLTPPNAATRMVKAFPVIFWASQTDCSNQVNPCPITVTNTTTISSSNSYSVTDGISSTVSNTYGNSSAIGIAKTSTSEVSDMIDTSYSFTATDSKGGSNGVQVADAITNTTELQLGKSKTLGTTRDVTNTTTCDINGQTNFNSEINKSKSEEERQDVTDSWGREYNFHTEGTVTAEANFGFGRVSGSRTVGFGVTQSENHSTLNSKGTTNTEGSSESKGGFLGYSNSTSSAVAFGHSESDSEDTRRSDSISDTKTSTKSSEENYQISNANTVGNSKTHSSGRSQGYTANDNFEQSFTQMKNNAQTKDEQNSVSLEKTNTLSFIRTLEVPPGEIGVIALLIKTESTQMQFSCLEDGDEVFVYADIKKFEPLNEKNGILGLITGTSPENYFQVLSTSLDKKIDYNVANSLPSGKVVNIEYENPAPFNKVILRTTRFELVVTQFGNMKIRVRGSENDIRWQTYTSVKRTTDQIRKGADGDTVFGGSNVRLSVTDFGHILLEAEGLFLNQPVQPFTQYYVDDQKGEYTTNYAILWSNVPKHMRYQIGTKRSGYNLVLEETGPFAGTWLVDLVLYDGGGSVVWCALLCNSPVKQGFRFPDNSLYPTDFPTDTFDKRIKYVGDKSPHNSIDPIIAFLPNSTFYSENMPEANCQPIMKSGQGIKSPNGRFSLILSNSGNLVLKDGPRTMWESMTADVWFAKAPYTMRLSNKGVLYVTDSWNKLIFSTALKDTSTTKNTRFSLEDSGEFTVRYNLNNTLLTSYFSMPLYNLFLDPIHTCYARCNPNCLPIRPLTITALYSNGSDYTPYPFNNNSLGINSPTGFYTIQTFNTTDLNVAFDLDGRLQAFSTTDIKTLLWNNTMTISGVGNYISKVSDNGRWSVYDANGVEIWFTKNGLDEGEVCRDGGPTCSVGACCVGPNDLIKKCRKSCLTPVENDKECNGKTDFCKSGGSCCFGANDFVKKCRANSTCVPPIVTGQVCKSGGIPCAEGACCLGVNDFDLKCRPKDSCVDPIPLGETCIPGSMPCAGTINSCCFSSNEFVTKCRVNSTCVAPIKEGDSCEPGGLPCASGKCCLGSGDASNKCLTTCNISNLFNINRPGKCITLDNDHGLRSGKCDLTKFSFIENKIVHNSTNLCVAGTKTEAVQLTLEPCINGTQFSFNKFGDSTFRLFEDDRYIIDDYGVEGEVVTMNYLQTGGATNNIQQQFSLDVKNVKFSYSNLYDINRPNVCLVYNNGSVITGQCEISKFVYVNQLLLNRELPGQCISGSEGKSLVLQDCDYATRFNYNVTGDLRFTMLDNDQLSIDTSGPVGSNVTISSSVNRTDTTGQLSFDLKAVKFPFDNLRNLYVAVCIGVVENTVVNTLCDENQFAFIGRRLVYNKEPSLCISGTNPFTQLTLQSCLDAIQFTFNKYKDYSFRLLADDRFVLDNSGQLGGAVTLKQGPGSITTNINQKFSFNNTDLKFSLPMINLYDMNTIGACVKVNQSVLVNDECNDSKWFFDNDKLVYGNNPYKCLNGNLDGTPLKLADCNQVVRLTYNSFNDSAFRYALNETFVVDGGGKIGGNVTFTYIGREKANQRQQFSGDVLNVKIPFSNIYNIKHPRMCVSLSADNKAVNAICSEDKFGLMNNKLRYSKDARKCLTVVQSSKLELVPCESATRFIFNNQKIRWFDNTEMAIDSGDNKWNSVVDLKPAFDNSTSQQFSFNQNDVVPLNFIQILKINSPGICLGVNMDRVENVNCDIVSGSQSFAYSDDIFWYKYDVTKCLQGLQAGAPLSLVPCDQATEFNYQPFPYWNPYFPPTNFALRSKTNESLFVDSSGIVGEVPTMNDMNIQDRQQFASDWKLVQVGYQLFFAINRPGDCINFDADQKLVIGGCGSHYLAIINGRLLGRYCPPQLFSTCELHDLGTYYNYNPDDHSLKYGSFNLEYADDGHLFPSYFSGDASKQKFTFNYLDINFWFANIYNIKRAGRCINVNWNRQLVSGICGQDLYWAPFMGKFVYKYDKTLCISGSPSDQNAATQLELVSCTSDRVGVYASDFSRPYVSFDVFPPVYRMDDGGVLGGPVRLISHSSWFYSLNENQQFSLDASKVQYNFRKIEDIQRPGQCLTVQNGQIVLWFCNDDYFDLVNDRLVWNKNPFLCITGYNQLYLEACTYGATFSYNKFGDKSFRLFYDDRYAIDDYGVLGKNAYLYPTGTGATTNQQQRFSF